MSIESSALSTYLAINTGSPEAAVLRLLVELGAQVVGADEGSLLVLDDKAGDLVFAMTVGGPEHALLGKRVPLGEGLTGLAAATQEVQIGAPKFRVHDGRRVLDGSPGAVIAAPMLARETLVGVITAVSFQEGKTFSGDDAKLYARLAAVAGVVVDQRRALDSVRLMAGQQRETVVVGGSEPLELKIAAQVGRLASAHPGALSHISRLLDEVEALTATR